MYRYQYGLVIRYVYKVKFLVVLFNSKWLEMMTQLYLIKGIKD